MRTDLASEPHESDALEHRMPPELLSRTEATQGDQLTFPDRESARHRRPNSARLHRPSEHSLAFASQWVSRPVDPLELRDLTLTSLVAMRLITEPLIDLAALHKRCLMGIAAKPF